MPFAGDDVRFNLMCGPGADGRWRGSIGVRVEADALRRLGLHPSQPSSVVDGPSPPKWWHAAGERYAVTGSRLPRRP